MRLEVEKAFKIKLEISQREACLITLGLELVTTCTDDSKYISEDTRNLAKKLAGIIDDTCDINGISAEADDIHQPFHDFVSLDSDEYTSEKK
jgi:hypothetical protein